MSFRHILGHTKEINVLKAALSSGRVAHSFLFAGPDGVGKRLTAVAFARALNCQLETGTIGCGCPDCSMIDAGTHPNLVVIQPTDTDGEVSAQGLIRIEEIRDVQNALRYRVERGKKVIIIDNAERLMPAAANAFLKTLEEPPPSSVIILITGRPADLLLTVVSRCQRVTFRPVDHGIISSFLKKEKGIAEAAADAAARLCGGSFVNALMYIDPDVHEKRRDIIGRITELTADDTDGALKLAEDLSKRDDIDEVLEFLKVWYRDKIVFQEGEKRLIVNSDMSGFIEKGGTAFKHLSASFYAIEKARRDIMPPRYANKLLAMEAMVLRLIGA